MKTADTQTGLAAPQLARIRCNGFSRAVWRDLKSRNEMHKTMCRIVGTTRSEANLLWRWERSSKRPTILVQATAPMDLDALPDDYGDYDGPRCMAGHLQRIADGATVQYRIDINAATQNRRVVPSGKRAAVPIASIPTWWHRKAEAFGLRPDGDALTVDTETVRVRDRGALHIARLEGYGEVINAADLRGAITSGVGRGRSYGCGLLTLRHI